METCRLLIWEEYIREPEAVNIAEWDSYRSVLICELEPVIDPSLSEEYVDFEILKSMNLYRINCMKYFLVHRQVIQLNLHIRTEYT